MAVTLKAVALLLVVAACGLSDDHIRAEFHVLYPAAVIVQAGLREGDDANALWCATYRNLPDTSLREQVWLYRRISGEWRVTSRDSALAKDKICERAA